MMVQNPFNGIESSRVGQRLALRSLCLNPFNGIESPSEPLELHPAVHYEEANPFNGIESR